VPPGVVCFIPVVYFLFEDFEYERSVQAVGESAALAYKRLGSYLAGWWCCCECLNTWLERPSASAQTMFIYRLTKAWRPGRNSCSFLPLRISFNEGTLISQSALALGRRLTRCMCVWRTDPVIYVLRATRVISCDAEVICFAVLGKCWPPPNPASAFERSLYDKFSYIQHSPVPREWREPTG
jgi:hypothetical protein